MQKLKLIDDKFSPTEFKEILYNLFLKKIEFHKTNNFSAQIKYEIDETIAVQKMTELNQSIEKIAELFEEAKQKDLQVIVFSEVQIEFIDSNKNAISI